jgi:4-amino-4-deoxy-L-arabinose transferase-like glycosyltransferase
VSDEEVYNNLALSIVNNGSYDTEGSYSRPPLYSFFISIIYFLFGQNFIIVRIIQAILDSLMCVLIYELCRRLFTGPIAWTASLMSACYLLFIKGASRFLTEPLFTFLLFLAVFYIYKTKDKSNFWNLSILGILISALTLIKGIGILFLPFLFLIFIAIDFYKPSSYKDVIKKFIVISFAFIIPMSIWTYRNYKVYHALIPVSTQTGYALYDCYFPKDGKIFGVNVDDDNVRYAMSLNSQVEASRYLTGKTFEFIKRHPFKILKMEILKVLYFWAPFDWEVMGIEKGVFNFQYMFILPFSFFGIFLLMRRFSQYAPLYIPILYLFLMSLMFYGSPRFRMPIEPFLIIFFAAGIARFFKVFSNKSIPFLIAGSYACVTIAMYLYTDMVKIFIRDIAKCIGIW